MSEALKVQKRRTHATVMMQDVRRFRGYFYLAEQARSHGGEENLFDLLNTTDRLFLPFELEDDGALILLPVRKLSGILLHSHDFIDLLAQAAIEEGALRPMTIYFPGQSLSGTAYVGDLHPDHRRGVDLLNDPRPFFLFQSGTKVYILNKTGLNFAVTERH